MQLAVAVSGGADSVALMLLAAKQATPAFVTALSVDHGTRRAATAERDFAKASAERLGVRFHTLTPTIQGYGHAYWRQARYEALTAYCHCAGIDTLWLGHHADDAVETAAIRLLAGGPLSSLAGISGTATSQGIRIERPLLRLSARDIRRLNMQAGFGWIEDPSNRNLAYKRSTVRRVMPKPEHSRLVIREMVRDAASWRVASERVEQKAWNLVARDSGLGSIQLHRQRFSQLPASLRAALLRRAANFVVGDPDRLRNVDFDAAAASIRCGAIGGAFIEQFGDQIWISRNPSSIGGPVPLTSNMTWDERAHLRIAATLPTTGLMVSPVGDRRIGSMSKIAPRAALSSLPSVEKAGTIVAIPNIGVWRGPDGPFWASYLRCRWLDRPEPNGFELAL
jgi:tRNA(Ile)-lysidine synthase